MATYAGDISFCTKTNYARLGHASQSLIPKLLQQLLLFYEPTSRILNDCLSSSSLKNKLNTIEWINIRKANTDGYADFDISLIYKLLRNLKLIPKPTRGWDPHGGPVLTETTIGDDLERFRKSRNEILHRGNTNVSDRELTEYFTQFKDIAQRLELALSKKKNELVSEFQNLETCCMDGISEQILANLAKKEKEFTLSNEISELMSLVMNAKSTDSRTLIKKPLQDGCCVEGEIACLSCEIIEDETAVSWYKDDIEIIPSTDIILKVHGKIHELSIPRTEMKDGGRYSIKVKQSTSEAKLTVKALISNHLVDTTCLEGSIIVLSCEVSVEGIGGIWYKDDSIVDHSSKQYLTAVNSRIHLLIFQSEIKDGGKYVFKIGDKISSAILTVKAVITKHLENVTCIEDQSLSLVCELAEKDISVTWLKDEKVIEASKNIVPEIHNNAHILKFKKLSKTDGGKYTLMAKEKKTEAVVLVKAKSTIPDQILLMDEKDKEMYLEIIKSGTERRYYIRLMIVGENGVGKTCLMRRLLGEDIDDVTSTDGVDVVIHKCKVRLSDGKWILNEEDTVEQDRNVRMKRALTDEDTILPEAKKRAEPNPLESIHIENKDIQFGEVLDEALVKSVTEIKDIYTGKGRDQANDTDMQFTNELMESLVESVQLHKDKDVTLVESVQLHKDKDVTLVESVQLHKDKDVTLKSERRVGLLDTLSDVMNVELPKEFFADCAVWDFAGQKEFYATHQTFLTNCAIYLLTTDLSKELSSQRPKRIYDVDLGEVGSYIDFWLDTIHCYATTESPDESVDEPPLDKLEPRIIIVCTGTDKVEGELNEQKALFEKQMKSRLKGNCTRKHIKSIQYLSNKEPLEKDFLELQSVIFETATEMSSWGKELPLRWIHLETALDGERDAGSNILPFHLIVKLAKDNSLPASGNEEIILFLRYQHECGHVIFFKDLPDYIILNPRWVIDAFKCLVSADQFQGHLLHLEDWTELEETGRLTNKLMSKLFEKMPNLKFTENKEHLLHVLEKFDIIVKPNNIENMTSYYMPCMIKPLSFNEICDHFGVHTPSCHRTSWLLLEFEFLPPAFFNHVLVGYIRKFKVSIASTENGGRLSLYRGIGVFDINKSGCQKLILCADKKLIAFQIWIYGNVLQSTFHYFRQTLTNMVDMLSERYQICCKYKVKIKCSESDYQKTEGRLEYKVFQDDETYFCPEHHREHEWLDVSKYWFSDKVVEGMNRISSTCGQNVVVNGNTAEWCSVDSGGRLFLEQPLTQHHELVLKLTESGYADVGILTVNPKDLSDVKQVGSLSEFTVIQNAKIHHQTRIIKLKKSQNGYKIVLRTDGENQYFEVNKCDDIWITVNIIYGTLKVQIDSDFFKISAVKRGKNIYISSNQREAHLNIANPCAVCFFERPIIRGETLCFSVEPLVKDGRAAHKFSFKVGITEIHPEGFLPVKPYLYDLTFLPVSHFENTFNNVQGEVAFQCTTEGVAIVQYKTEKIVLQNIIFEKSYLLIELYKVKLKYKRNESLQTELCKRNEGFSAEQVKRSEKGNVQIHRRPPKVDERSVYEVIAKNFTEFIKLLDTVPFMDRMFQSDHLTFEEYERIRISSLTNRVYANRDLSSIIFRRQSVDLTIFKQYLIETKQDGVLSILFPK